MTLRQFLFTSLPLVACSVVLMGCPLQTTTSSTLGGGSSSTSAPPPSSAREADSNPGQDNFKSTYFNRDDFYSLRGLTIEQAKAAAKKKGHTGEVKIREFDELVAGCAAGTVCSASDEREDQSGMKFDETLLLRINKSPE